MDATTKKQVKGVRVTPKRSPEQQRRLGDEAIRAIHALGEEMRRNGMTPVKARAILRELANERKARRRAR